MSIYNQHESTRTAVKAEIVPIVLCRWCSHRQLLSSGMSHCIVWLQYTDISYKSAAFIIRSLGGSRHTATRLHGITQQQTVIFHIIRHIHKIVESDLALSCLSFRLSTWNNLAPTGRIFKKFDIRLFFENLLRKFKSDLNLTRIKGT
jgi:hypothetical protein